MNNFRQGWLVAAREMRERSRTRGFLAGIVVMLVVVVAAIVLPPVLETSGGTKDVGLTNAVPVELPQMLRAQGEAAGVHIGLHPYKDVQTGEEALRGDEIDVLVVGAGTLEWQGRADEQLQAIVTSALQLAVLRERAAAEGIDLERLRALTSRAPVENIEIGLVEGRGAEDSTAAILMTALLLMAIFLYGNLVLTGVVEEKSSRVVEVLLARIPARNLLAGKVAGIGLLGFAQFAVTGAAVLAAASLVDGVDIPAVSTGVLAWVVLWFMLGYALYAMAYGALGSLASRTEDAQSAAGPVGYVLVAGYWAAFLAVGANPDGFWSRTLSLFPLTAPFAMPGRLALGAAGWWEAVIAVILTLAAIAGLVVAGGRLYSNAILHSGPMLGIREAWRRASLEHERKASLPAPRSGEIAGPKPTPVSSGSRISRDHGGI